jgi:hypothetical protein
LSTDQSVGQAKKVKHVECLASPTTGKAQACGYLPSRLSFSFMDDEDRITVTSDRSVEWVINFTPLDTTLYDRADFAITHVQLSVDPITNLRGVDYVEHKTMLTPKGN